MNFAEYLRRIRSSPNIRDQIEHVELIPPRSARFAEPSQPLHPVLNDRLRELGVSRLYSHQASAVDSVRAGRHIVVVTPTASGSSGLQHSCD